MGRFNNYLSYIISIILFGLLLVLLTRNRLISVFVYQQIRNELILCDGNYEQTIMEDVFPQMIDTSYLENYEKFFDHDRNGNIITEKDSENTATSTDSNIATATEAYKKKVDEICTELQQSTSDETKEDVVDVVSNSDITPIIYDYKNLCDFDFLVNNCYVVDSTTNIKEEELDVEKLLGMDMTIDLNTEDYKILIYHTHGSETFADSREGVTEDTVIGIGDELQKQLWEKYKIKAYHDRNVYDMVDGVLDRSYAYTLSGEAVDKILEEYPTIEVIIDLHRDGVREDVRLVKTIDGKPTAQIMFLNGVSRTNLNGDIDYLYNPHKIENLSFSLKMHLAGKEKYGELMRRIYIRGYSFNLDKMPRATLVEVGAQTNTVEEAKNAMKPLAYILNEVLRDK